jgi:hypothetical protein
MLNHAHGNRFGADAVDDVLDQRQHALVVIAG